MILLTMCILSLSLANGDLDDRLDYYERVNRFGANDIFAKIGRESVVALTRGFFFQDTDGKFPMHPRSPTLSSSQDLCPAERFGEQSTSSTCSGILVDRTHVVTAASCLTESGPNRCRNTKFVFNYYVTGYQNGQPQYAEITISDVYSCGSVVRVSQNGQNWAVATLDREVLPSSGHHPVPALSTDAQRRTAGEALVTIGFPSGLPMKIEDGGAVISAGPSSLSHFTATKAGPTIAGSVVLTQDLNNPVMIGIVGDQSGADYVRQGSCFVVNDLCDGGQCGSQDVTYAFHTAQHTFHNTEPESTPLMCGGTYSDTTVGRPSARGFGSGDVTYTFTTRRQGEYEFDLCDSFHHSIARLYDASGNQLAWANFLGMYPDGRAFIPRGSNCGGRRSTFLSIALPPGQYTLLVEGLETPLIGRQEGSFTLRVSCRDPTDIRDPSQVVNCVGSWSEYGSCSATCGGGAQLRTYSITTNAANGGIQCPFRNGDTETRSCNNDACPIVDCVGSWSRYGSCSATCGGGVQSRTYSITTNAANGGIQCPHRNGDTEARSCNNDACPNERTPCLADHTIWSTRYGDCDSYSPAGRNHRWCDIDSVDGLVASQVCPGCGDCDPDTRTPSDNSLQCGSTVMGSITESTGEISYDFIARAGPVTFDLCNSDFDSTVRVLDADGNSVAFNSNNNFRCGGNAVDPAAAYLQTSLQEGQSYVVVVGGRRFPQPVGGRLFSQGNYALEVTCNTIACGETVSGTTVGKDSFIGSSSGEVIYEFVATTSRYVFDACQSSYDSLIRVYRNTARSFSTGSQRIEIARNDDHRGLCSSTNRFASHVTARTTIGVTYTLVVEGYNRAEGNYVVTARC